MVLLELFSGIGGFSKGLQAAGYSFEKVYFSEIEKHATANFKYNFPYAEHIGSVTEIGTAAIKRPDIITFGSPCQNFSAVGDGTGLQGFLDDFTKYGVYGNEVKPISRANRYAMLGNAVSVPVVRAVASRIRENTILNK